MVGTRSQSVTDIAMPSGVTGTRFFILLFIRYQNVDFEDAISPTVSLASGFASASLGGTALKAGRMILKIDTEDELLKPLIIEIVKATVLHLGEQRIRFGDRLAYSEVEAARLIGLNKRQLADERKRRRIKASRIVGGRIRYQLFDLIEYLNSRPWPFEDGATE